MPNPFNPKNIVAGVQQKFQDQIDRINDLIDDPNTRIIPPPQANTTPTYGSAFDVPTAADLNKARNEAGEREKLAETRLFKAEQKLRDAGYVQSNGTWGRWDEGTEVDEYGFDAKGNFVGQSSRKFVPVGANVPVMAEYRAAAEEANFWAKEREAIERFNFTGGPGGSSSGGSGGGGGGGGGGGSGAVGAYLDPFLAYQQVEGRKDKEIQERLDDFSKRAQLLYSLEDKDRGYQLDAIENNANLSKALLAGGIQWDTPGIGYVSPMRPHEANYAKMVEDSMPQWLEPDYQLNFALGNPMMGLSGLPGADGFNNPNFNAYGQPTSIYGYAVGTGLKLSDVFSRYPTGTGFAPPQFPGMPPGLMSYGQTGATPGAGQYNQNQFLPTSQQQFGGQDWDAVALDMMVRNISEGNAGAPIGWSGPNLQTYAGGPVPPAVTAALAQFIRDNPNNADIVYMMGGVRPADRPNAFGDAPLSFSDQLNLYNSQVNAWNTSFDNYMEMQKYIDGVTKSSASYGGYGGGGGGGVTGNSSHTSGGYSSLYGSSVNSALQEEMALRYAQLALDREVQMGRLQLDQDKFDEEKAMNVYQAAYIAAMTGQIADQHELALLKFAEEQVMNEFQRGMMSQEFEEALRRAQVQEQQWREQFGLQQEQLGLQRQELEAQLAEMVRRGQLEERQFVEAMRQFDSQFGLQQSQFAEQTRQFEATQAEQRRQFEANLALAIQRGELDQAEHQERIRQFDAAQAQQAAQFAQTHGLAERQFAAEQERRQQELGIERAKTVAQLGANPGDAVQRQFFMAGMSDPVGTAKDVFTGQAQGQKTFEQVQKENAPLHWENNYAQTMPTLAAGSDGFTREPMFIVGDSLSGRPTGTEELIYNPLGAPVAVIPNRELVGAGLMPRKAKGTMKLSDCFRRAS